MNTEIILIIGFITVIYILLRKKEPVTVKVEREEKIEPVIGIPIPDERFYNDIYDPVYWNDYWPLNDPYYYRRIDYHYDDYWGHPRRYDSLYKHRNYSDGVSGYGNSKSYHTSLSANGQSHSPSKQGSVSYTGGSGGVPLRRKHSFEKFTQDD